MCRCALKNEVYSAANDPRSQMIPQCIPQTIPWENEQWHGISSSGRDFNFKQIGTSVNSTYSNRRDKEFFG